MGTDVENPPSLSLNPFSPPTTPSIPPQISLSKPHPPPQIHRQLFVSLSRPIHCQLYVSLSPKSVSQTLKSLHRLPEVGASAIAASCRRGCRRWCRLAAARPSPPIVVAPLRSHCCALPSPSARPLCAIPPLVVVVRCCVGNHRRLPSPSAAAGCAPAVVVRRCSPLFAIAAVETIAVFLRSLLPLVVVLSWHTHACSPLSLKLPR
ncbi:hypothetical protein Scep_020194 [Stephania cephalantha]|uniref:Uncharacterized protein n=1 Tax=Stephania cephalantha TaxID=152367 RepID=A0AAP0NP15_9MAGN